MNLWTNYPVVAIGRDSTKLSEASTCVMMECKP